MRHVTMQFILLSFFSLPLLFAESNEDFKKCLINIYGVDNSSACEILDRVNCYIDIPNLQETIEEFIDKSALLNLQLNEEFSTEPLKPDDAVLQAPQWHEILFENSFVRILWASSKPGDREPPHTHQWKSLLLIIQGSNFVIDTDKGVELDFWPMGVYELDPDKHPYAYTNLGPSDFISLRFEIKS